MRTVPSSAWWLRAQSETIGSIVNLIDMELPSGAAYHFTTANDNLTYTLSGANTIYTPFQGKTLDGIQESLDVAVAVVAFSMVNSYLDIQAMLQSSDFRTIEVKIGRVFADTPNMGRMDVYRGTLGDFSYDRFQFSGQVRNIWKSINVKWPYYSYQDTCQWVFGSSMCGYNTSSITIAINTINVASSTQINILVNSGTISASYANGRFDFGRLTVTNGVNSGLLRTIRTHTGDLLFLSHPLTQPDLSAVQISIYPGCRKRLISDCLSLYNNSTNAFSWPWIPQPENAFVGM